MTGDSADQRAEINGTSWAAFVLGRFPFAIRSWLEAFTLASPQELLASLPFAKKPNYFAETLNHPYDVVPLDLFEELDEGLRALAVARAIDPGILIEIHRNLDGAEEICQQFAALIEDEAAAVSAAAWSATNRVDLAIDVAEYAFEPRSDLRQWWKLGSTIGKWLACLQNYGPAEISECPTFEDFVARFEGPSIASALNGVIEAEQLRRTEGSSTTDTFADRVNKSRDRIVELDQLLQRSRKDDVGADPILTINHREQMMILLGQQFRFDDFTGHARGGLKCFLFMATKPQSSLESQMIINKADLGIGPESLTIYFSHFRRVVQSRLRANNEHARYLQLQIELGKLIHPERGNARKIQPTKYKLALDKDRIDII